MATPMRFTENDKQFMVKQIDIDNDGFLIVRMKIMTLDAYGAVYEHKKRMT